MYDLYVLLFYRWDWRLDCLLAAFTRSKQHFSFVSYLEPVLSGTGVELSTANTDERDSLHSINTCQLCSLCRTPVYSQCVLAGQETTSRIERERTGDTEENCVFT